MNPTGQPQTAQNGAWVNGRQFWNGTWSNPGQINTQSNQVGAGQAVSQQVVQQTNPNNASYLAQQGAALPNANNPQPQQQTQGDPNAGGGSGLPQAPALDVSKLYADAYNTPEIQAANANIAAIDKQVADKQAALNEAVKNNDDNPFFSESTRSGRLAKLTSQGQNEMNSLLAQRQAGVESLTSKQAEAERQVNIGLKQYDINRQDYQDKLSQFNNLISTGALTNASDGTLASLSAQNGMSMDMIKSIQQKQQSAGVVPQIVTSTDNNGNQTITAVDKSTGQVIHSQTLDGVGKAKTGKGTSNTSGSSGSVTKNINQQFQQDLSSAKGQKLNGQYVGVYPQMVAKYAGSMSLQEINKLYQSSPQGKQWGTPKENPQQIKEFYDSLRGKAAKTTIN